MKTFLALLCICTFLATPMSAEDKKPVATATVVTPAEVAKLIAEKKATVLDIRTPEEFAGGHIAGAVNIDFRAPDFAQKIGALDKAKTYVVHCAGGGRSGQSLPALETAGLKSVLHLQQGFKGWQAAGQPVEKK